MMGCYHNQSNCFITFPGIPPIKESSLNDLFTKAQAATTQPTPTLTSLIKTVLAHIQHLSPII